MSIRIDGTNTTANPGITGSDTDTGLQFGTNEVKVVTGGTERATVDSAGRVGIATTPEAWDGFDALEVNEASIVSSGSGDAFFTANAYYDGAWKYKDAGVARNVYMNSDGIVFRTAPSGSADGAITWTEVGRWREGGGLTFNGDTAQANALDDYEEGLFTPTLTAGSGSITLSTSYDRFGYTKIGRVVHVQGQIVVGSVSSPSGTVRLSLPFTSATLNDRAGFAHTTFLAFYNGTGVTNGYYHNRLQIDHGSSSVLIRPLLWDGSQETSPADYMGAGSDLWFAFTYIAA